MSKERILVVDDSAAVVVFLQDQLRYFGYQVDVARDGEQALEKVAEYNPHLIVLDIMLPGMDGYEVCRLLKASPDTQTIPVLMLSAKGQAPERVLGLAAGADDYLPKPYDIDELKARVEILLRRAALPSDGRGRAEPPTADTSPRLMRIFLCHASDDKPRVREIYRYLQETSVDAWLDEERILPGQDWNREIHNAVDTADVVLVCLSCKSLTRAGFVQQEIRFALNAANQQPSGTIYLIPVKLEECSVPQGMEHLGWVNLFEDRGWEKLMRSLRKRAEEIGVMQPR